MVAFFILLLAVHSLCDFPLQGDFLAKAKRPGGVAGVPWQWALGWHAYMHAVGVALVTGRLYPGIIEFVAHTAIDYAKTREMFYQRKSSYFQGIYQPARDYSFTIDQLLHIATKVVIVGLRWKGWV